MEPAVVEPTKDTVVPEVPETPEAAALVFPASINEGSSYSMASKIPFS